MANVCPECDGELVRTPTKKKGMEVLKHKDAAAAKAAGCGMGFITVRTKGAVTNGGEKETGKAKEISGAGAKGGNEESGGGGGGYREAVRRSSAPKRGKTGGRSNRQSAQHVPERRAAAASGTGNEPDQPARGGTKRGWFDDVTETIFRK